MAKIKKSSSPKVIKWDIHRQIKYSTAAFTGNGVNLLTLPARREARWWSVTLALKLSVDFSDELEMFKYTFRPDAKLTFDQMMKIIANYIHENYSSEQLDRVLSGDAIAVACTSKPK